MLRALRYTGAGGVYLAQRVDDGAAMVLKEARPHTAFGVDGRDGQQRLRGEFEALTLMRDAGIAPQPVELFSEWEHLFLAQEHLAAPPFVRFLAKRNPMGMGDLRDNTLHEYWAACDTILDGVRTAIQLCHDRGISYGDLSLNNVLVCPDTLRVWLVDFESSRPLDGWHPDQPATLGFTAGPGSAALDDGRAFDEFGIASLELAMFMPRNGLRAVDEGALTRSTTRAACLLRRPLGDLLERLELPDEEGYQRLSVEVAVKETIRFIENVMTTDRADRVFPADPAVFTTNPRSVAYGVAGVAHALHRLTGQVPPALEEWVGHAVDGLDRMPPGLYFGWAGVGWTFLDVGLADLNPMEFAVRSRAIAVLSVTANIPASTALGLAATPAQTVLLAAPGPVLFFPSMNQTMWDRAATRRHVATLRGDGHVVVDPRPGEVFELWRRTAGTGLVLPSPDEVTKTVLGWLSGCGG